MPARARDNWWLTSGVAVTTAAIVALARLMWWPDSTNEESFLIAVVLSAYAGGLWTGLLSLGLSAILSAYLFLPPRYSILVEGGANDMEWMLLLLLGILVSLISEALHRARAMTQAASRLHEITLGSIGDGVITTDSKGRIRFMNTVAEQLTGWPLADAIGRPVEDVFTVEMEESGTAVPCPVGAVVAGVVAGMPDDAVLVSRSGKRLAVADSVAPIRDHDGLVRGAVLVFRDATAERRAQNALREQVALQSQVERVAATAPGILYSFQLHADGRTTFPFASSGLRAIFGIEPEVLAVDAAPVFDMMLPEDAVRVRASIEASARSLRIWREAFRVQRPDGMLLHLEGASMPERQDDGSTLWHGFVTDRTEQWRTTEALRSTRETLQMLIEQAPISIAMLDRGMTYLAASHQWRSEFGTGDDVVGRCHYDVFPDLPDEWRAIHRECLAGAVRSAEDDEWRRADGKPRWIRWAIHPWKTGSGDVGGIIIFAEDVTERRQQQSALLEREARLSGIIKSAMDAIITVDASQRIVLANPAAEQIFERPTPDLIGRSLNDLLPERHRSVHTHYVRKFTGNGETNRRMDSLRPLVGLRADGEEFPLEATISHVDVGGERLATVILRDVTRRIRAEEAMRASDERFRQLAESINEVFYLTHVDGSRMDYISPAYEAIWGRPCADVYASPRSWVESVHPGDVDRVMSSLGRMAETGFNEEYRIVRPDGVIRWIRARSFPVTDPDGVVRRVAGVAEDITERRDLEAQLRQMQKMESVGQLAGGVAHDFNNWLTVISANCELTLMNPSLDGEVTESINEIRHAGERAASLTRQLLTFSRQQVAEARVVDLNAIVTDTEKMLRRLMGEDVAVDASLTAVSRVHADPGHLSQVLMNLAVNARDAMPGGGRLTIDTSDVVVRPTGADDDAPFVLLRVSDTGSGMSPEVRTRIFEPFFTTKGVGQGTGLGLAVVHGIVSQVGGWIDVESEEGVGTTFLIHLPAVSRTTPVWSKVVTANPVPGTETILLVEDEDLVRRVASRALRAAGYTVIEATDGNSGVRAATAHPGVIHLLLTDVVMPGMGGRMLADQVSQLRPDTRVLYTSGYLDDAIVRHGIQHAEVAFLPKPYDSRSLLGKVREVLDRA